jgi:hypothetical protein
MGKTTTSIPRESLATTNERLNYIQDMTLGPDWDGDRELPTHVSVSITAINDPALSTSARVFLAYHVSPYLPVALAAGMAGVTKGTCRAARAKLVADGLLVRRKGDIFCDSNANGYFPK